MRNPCSVWILIKGSGRISLLSFSCPMNNIDLKPEPKHPFVELLVINSDGVPINTFCGENAPLAEILSKLSRLTPEHKVGVVKMETPMPQVGQTVYAAPWEMAVPYVWTFVDKSRKDIEDQVKAMPETAKYYFVVSV